MKNSEILSALPQTLTNIERQTRFILGIAQERRECPACQQPCSQIEASGLSVDDYPAGKSHEATFHCPHCKRQLTYVVPFMGPSYLWRLAQPLPPLESPQLIDAIEEQREYERRVGKRTE